MNESTPPETPDGLETEASCLECGTTILSGQERMNTDEGAFCRNCWTRLTGEVEAALAQQGEGVNWVNAAPGAVLGAAVGVLAWWGFTVLTKISFGLVAVVIGWAVGKGILMFTGGKRSTGLQVLSVMVSVAGFFYASYLVLRTLILREYAQAELSLLPSPELFVEVLSLDFGLMDLVFLGIVAYQAWKGPAPFRLN